MPAFSLSFHAVGSVLAAWQSYGYMRISCVLHCTDILLAIDVALALAVPVAVVVAVVVGVAVAVPVVAAVFRR